MSIFDWNPMPVQPDPMWRVPITICGKCGGLPPGTPYWSVQTPKPCSCDVQWWAQAQPVDAPHPSR